MPDNWWEAAPVVKAAPAGQPAADSWWRDAPVVEPPKPEPEALDLSPEGLARLEFEASGQGGVGVAKGAGNTATGLGQAMNWLGSKLGINRYRPEAFEVAREAVAPTNPAQEMGFAVEQGAEFAALPGPGKVRAATKAASLGLRALEAAKAGAAAGTLARAQGASEGTAAVTGVLGGLPVGEAVGAAGEWVAGKAAPLVRAAIKPTVAAMRRIAGAGAEGIDAKASGLVRFIIENGVTTPEKAHAIVQEAERDLQRALAVKGAPTDAPQRAVRYLDALERSAAKQALPGQDVALIRRAAAEVLQSGLGEDIPGAAEAVAAARAAKTAPKAAPTAPVKDDVDIYLRGRVPMLRSSGTADPGRPIFDAAGRRVGTRGGVSWKEYAGVNLPELSDVTPKRMAAAIEKDGDNPLYVRIKEAVRREWDDIAERTGIVDETLGAGEASFDPAAIEAAAAPAVDPDGIPLRRLRTDVGAAEALERARANSRWSTRKSWGEQKGAEMEASKAVERAMRDSVKAAVPEAAPILRRQGQALEATKVLDRAQFRAANRDAVSLPAHVIAAGEIATGRFPVLAFAANWLRNNQLKAGIWADRLGRAVADGNAPQVAFILHRLGIGVSPQLMRPAPAAP